VYVEGLPARSQRSMAKQIDPVPSLTLFEGAC
jgi:hypothetical protein